MSHALFRTTMFAVSLVCTASFAKTVTDVFNFKMTLEVPRIYDNMQSKGYRKYQKQTVKGKMFLTYDDASDAPAVISFSDIWNTRHKVNGAAVTYTVTPDESVQSFVNVIGHNRTMDFHTASVCFGVIAEPSYIWGAPEEDNSLYVTLAGSGRTSKVKGARVIRKMSGTVSGAIGCGCSFYGHVSPTRMMGAYGPSATVVDVASVFGRWRAVRVSKESSR